MPDQEVSEAMRVLKRHGVESKALQLLKRIVSTPFQETDGYQYRTSLRCKYCKKMDPEFDWRNAKKEHYSDCPYIEIKAFFESIGTKIDDVYHKDRRLYLEDWE